MILHKNQIRLQTMLIHNQIFKVFLHKLFQIKEEKLSICNLNNGFKNSGQFQSDAVLLPKVVTSQLNMLFTQLDLIGTVLRIKVFYLDNQKVALLIFLRWQKLLEQNQSVSQQLVQVPFNFQLIFALKSWQIK